nr:DUF3300 domain-containing protein [Neoroseomonas nitratireducens]
MGQVLAPIALHPDQLLTQMPTAASYPLEIVQAKRWRDRDASLSDEAPSPLVPIVAAARQERAA